MKRLTNGKVKWTHYEGKTLKEVLYPVLEATEPLLFTVTDKDIATAKEMRGDGNPNHCVAACAVKRQSNDAYFQRDIAYLLQMHQGKAYAKRYRFGGALRRAIVAFDAGGIFPTGTYKLLPITASQTLVAKRLRNGRAPLTKRKVRGRVKFTARGKITPLS